MSGGQMAIGSLMIVSTVIFHISSLVFLAGKVQRLAGLLSNWPATIASTVLLVAAVLFIIGIHTLEAWAWAALYVALGEFVEFERSLYFSVVTATTLGYGDITLSDSWRILSTFEAMGGLLLFGASTAFLLGLMRHMFEDIENSHFPQR